MTGIEEFLLHVDKASKVILLHNAKIGGGYVEFKITGEDGRIIDKYRLSSNKLINRVYNLNKGIYQCTIERDVKNSRENFRFYYDKRLIRHEYLKRDYTTSNR